MNKIIDEDYYDFIINNTTNDTNSNTNDSKKNNNITYLNERHLLLHVKYDEVNMCDLGMYPYHRFPSLFVTNSDLSIEKSGVGSIQRNPHLSLFGQGVLIGIVDTGIDYLNSAFRYNDGTSRIEYIWDQTIYENKVPNEFNYGSEYSKDDINRALASNQPFQVVPTKDENGHGTAIASIVAGSIDSGDNFTGVAPEAEFIVVKLKKAKKYLYTIFGVPKDELCFSDTDVLLGIRYLITKAKELHKPIAICIAIGTSQGGHDGLGATSSYLNYLSQMSKIGVAISAGNEGNKKRHYFSDNTTFPYSSDIELNVDEKDISFSVEIWSTLPARCIVEVIAPTGESTKYVYPSISTCSKFSFVFIKTKIWINNLSFEEETGDQLILVRFLDPVAGIWKIRIQNIDKESFSLHAWLPANKLISDGTYFIRSNPNTTITSPGNAILPLTVTSYNQINDSIMESSSRGFSRIGIVKPNIAAPGYKLQCASINSNYVNLSGTGAATAHATGILALLLEWAYVRGNYTTITGNDLNRLLIRGANRSPQLTYPNDEWGYGKINIQSFFEKLGIY